MPDTASENVSIPRTKAELPWEETISTALCAMLGLVGVVLHWADFTSAGSLSRAAFAGACVAGAIGPVQNAWSLLRRGILSVDLLMIVAAVGAAIIGDWVESVALLFLFSLSGTLEAFATYRTTRSIESLIQLRPRDALRIDGTSADGERVAIEALRVNDIVRVRPGERFPVDGVVSEGETWADESTLTGESEAIHKPLDSNVYAGTINGPGTVLVRMTRAVADTTIARIVHMVQEAQAQKTPTQRFVESWQQPYVIGVMLMASLALLGARYLHTSNWHDAFYHAMVILVAASPCAVVVSSPSVMLSAIARAGRQGVLFKGGVHVEGLGKVDVMAFDKTGTVTIGKPSVTQVWVDSTTDARQLVELAAAVERHSEHPLGVPVIAEAAARGIEAKPTTLDDFHSHTGLGIHARIAGTWIGIGREGLFATHELNTPTELLQQAQQMREQGHTALLVITKEPSMRGVIGVADQIRPEAVATIAALKRLGIRKIVMLTGDHERVARVIASKVDVDDVRAGLLPDQKVTAIKSLSNDGSMVAMVGDGVNDAPALAAAQVGIAMGGAGTDVALEVADVVLMRDDLRTLPFAVWISRLAIRRVRQNIIFAFGVICVLVIASFFNLPLWLSVLGHEGSTVLVVFNGLRLLWQKQPDFDMPRIATEESSRSNEKGKD